MGIILEVEGNTPDVFIDNLYMSLKSNLEQHLSLTIDHIEALAEQLTELAARKKEELSGECKDKECQEA